MEKDCHQTCLPVLQFLFLRDRGIMIYGMYRAVEILEHAIKIVHDVLERNFLIVVIVKINLLCEVNVQLMQSLFNGGYKKNTWLSKRGCTCAL